MPLTQALAAQFRMPTAFGPAPGPRNVPAGAKLPPGPERTSTVSFTAPGDAGELQTLLPEQCTLLENTWTLQVTAMTNLHWFAGRGYNIASISIPVRYRDGDTRVDGRFVPVMWESKADPIITGRDELGFPKIFADIEVRDLPADGTESVVARASWEGTEFLAASVRGLAPAPPPDPALPVITRRYVPAVGELEQADVDYLTIVNPAAPSSVSLVRSVAGRGAFRFTSVTWEQVPFQYPVINALSELTIAGEVAVYASTVEGIFGMPTNRRIGNGAQ